MVQYKLVTMTTC